MLRYFGFCLIAAGFFASAPAGAQEFVFKFGEYMKKGELELQEVDFPVVEFMTMDIPQSLMDRLDAVLQGITIDVPPEYDYYGYEIRRYMAHVGSFRTYASEARIEEGILSVKKARIIFDYWQQDLAEEMDDISDKIDAENASYTVRSTYKYNLGVISAFQIECQNWIDGNEAILDFLQESTGLYKTTDSEIIFRSKVELEAFTALINARDKARQEVIKYNPFAGVLY